MMSRNVPKLRFKGFEDEWKEYRLGELFNFKNGLNKEKEYFGKGTPIINYTDVYKKIELTKKNILGLVEVNEKERENYSVRKGDVFFTRTSETINEIGYTAVVTSDVEDTVFSGFVLRARPKVEYLSAAFCKYCFYTHNARKEIITKSSYTTRALTSGSLLSGMNIFLPSLQEQEKIANFLSKVDSIIEKQGKKVQYWNSYKKGMMQKIFSQKIRFKDENGRNYPEWEKKNLKYVLSEISEKTKENNQYEVLSSTANGVFKQSEYFNREIASADNTGYKILRLNQIVLSPQNLWLGNINYNNKYDMGIVSPSYKIFNINKNLNEKYISYIIKTDRMLYGYKQASEQGASVVRRNLNMDLFYDILINIPCVEEQEKIANFLSNIDNIIEKESKKLEELKQWKKGLLQQMFV
ncbi:restriction endonuclease subunit S [Clostridium perfringens]|nr:restriction endonuclease subunit S [Clostridium perfringens]